MHELSMTNIQRFKAVLSRAGNPYRSARFRYVVHVVEGRPILLKGIVIIAAHDITVPSSSAFENQILKVGEVSVFETYLTVSALIDDLMAGTVKLPFGAAEFPPNPSSEHRAHFTPLHTAGQKTGYRMAYLQLVANQSDLYRPSVEVDWDLKAGLEPFDNFNELLEWHGLGEVGAALTVDFQCGPVIRMDTGAQDERGRALPTVVISRYLDKTKVRLGYKIQRGQFDIKRGSLSGDQLLWTEYEDTFHGVAHLDRDDAQVQCTATYEDIAYHTEWLTDAKPPRNSRRVVFDGIDANLDIIREIINDAGKKRNDQRDVEAAVGVLAWMLGFSVVHLGGVARLQEAADVILATPSGQILVVECTISLLKTDKVSKLHARTEAIRRQIGLAGQEDVQVIPVLATTKPLSELEVDRALTDKHGFVVLAREDLLSWIDKSQVPSDSEALFNSIARLAEDAKQRAVT